MKADYTKLLRWFLGFGKLKGSALYFLFAAAILCLFVLIWGFISAIFSSDPFFAAFSNNLSFDSTYLIFAFLVAFRFYHTAEEEILKHEKLRQQGLTLEDLVNIEFVKTWRAIRPAGMIKYCFYNGGPIAGMLLFFPVSIICFFVSDDGHHSSMAERFPKFGDMVSYILSCVLISYALGAFIYRIRWRLNERRFMRLTDPLSIIQFDAK